MKLNILIFPIATYCLLAACATTTHDDFSCPVDQPEGCRNVEEADGNALKEIRQKSKSIENEPRARALGGTKSKDENGGSGFLTNLFADDDVEAVKDSLTTAAETKQASRSQEQTARIWFAPFIDSKGNLHHASEVSIVLTKPEWSLNNEGGTQ